MPRPKKSATPHSSSDDAEEAGRYLYLAISQYGLEVEYLTKPTAFGILRRLKLGMRPDQAAREMGLLSWELVGPSGGQIGYMKKLELPWQRARNKREAGLLLDAALEPLKTYRKLLREIDKATSAEALDSVGRDVRLVADVLPADHVEPLVEEGRKRRQEINNKGPI